MLCVDFKRLSASAATSQHVPISRLCTSHECVMYAWRMCQLQHITLTRDFEIPQCFFPYRYLLLYIQGSHFYCLYILQSIDWKLSILPYLEIFFIFGKLTNEDRSWIGKKNVYFVCIVVPQLPDNFSMLEWLMFI